MANTTGWCGSHMKTHFVLNTLGNIQFLIRHNPGEAERLMEIFIDYSKATLRYENQAAWNSLTKELTYLEQYENLMVMRFGEHFCLKKDIAVQMDLPPMTLQGLIENAFYHGVRDLLEEGKVSIRSYTEGDEDVLEVSDNGKGIADVGATLRNAMEESSFLGKLNAAISQDETTALQIISTIQKGTKVQIRRKR